MDHVAEIAQLLADVLAQPPFSVERPVEDLATALTVPKDPQLGDHAFPCFVLAKDLRKAPPAIASELAEALEPAIDASGSLAGVEATGPYLNFRVDTAAHAAGLVPAILGGEFTARRQPETRSRVMVEYSQPNTHKAFHVGHTRNVSLGDCLVRLFEWAGHDVVAANYIGDEGAHIAKCLWYYTTFFRGEVPTTDRGEFLGELYSKATELLDFKLLTRCPHPGVRTARVESVEPHPSHDGWTVVAVDDGETTRRVVCGGRGFAVGDVVGYASVGSQIGGRRVGEADKAGVTSEGMIVSAKEISISDDAETIHVFPADTELGVEVAELERLAAAPSDRSVLDVMSERTEGVAKVLQAIEAGEPEITALWKETRQWSLEDFDEIYHWLDARFDHVFFESEVGEEGKNIVQEYFEKGVLERSDGAIGARLEEHGLPFFLLLRSNGTGLYSTKDIALARRKFEEFAIDRSVYVVDVRQSLHFQQVFKTLELMGYERAKQCHHLAYGFVLLPEGEMSSRTGNVILFSQLKERLMAKIRQDYLDDKEWPEGEKSDAARAIALASIKYGMLNQDNVKNIVFDLDAWTNAKGNTGPYLMYAYTRTRSIRRKLDREGLLEGYDQPRDWSLLSHEREKEVLRKLDEFPDLALRAAEEYQPKLLCIYLYDLCRLFSRMYTECPIKLAETAELRFARLDLAEATGVVIRDGLALLGITAIERM